MVNEISKQTLSLVSTRTAINDVDGKPAEQVSVKEERAPEQKLEQNSQESIVSIVESTASRLNEAVQSVERDLQFSVDDESGDTIITVLDRQTNEVIRQIPSEEVLAIRDNIESLKGILFSAEV